jgi:PAS domain S-box-containing protein
MSFLHSLFSSDGFMPHGHCYMWDPKILWLHITSDALITLAYLTIPITLIHIARRRKDLPFDWIFACFGVFILACGATHAMEIWSIWHPTYWLSGSIKAVTAVASVSTAVLLMKLVPKLLAIPSPNLLRQANEAWEKEIAERKRTEAALGELHRQNELILSTISEGIHWIGRDGRIIFENAASARLLGWESAELIGKPAHATMHHRHADGTAYPQSECHIYAGLQTGKSRQVDDEVFWRKDGTSFPVEYTSTPARGEDGQILGTVVIFTDTTERRQAAQQLRESEEKFRQLVDNITDVFWITSPDMQQMHYVSPAYERIWGRSAESLYAHPQEWAEAILPEDRERTWSTVSRLTIDAPSVSVEYRIVRSDGDLRWVHDRGFQVRDAAGHVVRLAGIVTDITERKQAEDALRETEGNLTRTVTDANIGLWEWNLTTNGVYLSPQWKSQLGYADHEIPHRFEEWESRVHPDDLAPTLAKIRALIDDPHDRYNAEYRMRHKDGSDRWIFARAQILRDGADAPARMVGCHIDITERKLAEVALRASEADFRALAESMPQMVWITRPDGWNQYFSQQWMDYTGLSLEETLGHGWNKPFHPEDQQRAWDAWQHATATAGVYSIESRLRRADGVYRWWLIRGVPQMDATGTILKWFGTCTDIHNLKQSNEALRESEEKFRLLADNITDVFWINSPDLTNVYYVSPGYESIWGRSIESLYANSQQWIESILPEDRDGVIAAFGPLMADEPRVSVEYRIARPDGTIRWVHDRGFQVRDAAGNLVRLTGFVSDVTDRKQAQLALSESEEMLRQVMDSSQDCIKILDLEGRLIWMNAGGWSIMEIDDFESVKNQSWVDFWQSDEQPQNS